MERGVAEEADGIIMVDSQQFFGQREKYAFARNEKKGARLLRMKSVEDGRTEDLLAANFDFVPLSKLTERRRSVSDCSMEGDYEKHFHLIDKPAGPYAKPEDQDLEYAAESDSNAEGRTIKVDEAIRQKHVELSRQADKEPSNLEVWLAFINHQDAMRGLGEFEHRKITSAEIQSTAEIKISMYEKALKSAGETLQNRERILLGMMKEGAKVWSQKEQAKRWENLTSQEIGSSRLWREYINYRMSDFPIFSYEEVKELFKSRLALLDAAKGQIMRADGGRDSPKLDAIHQQQVYVLLRATLFMRELEYTELSVGIWQLVLEFNFSCKRQYGGERRGDIEDFWQSEVPRIGEEGAQGWKEFDDEDEPESDVRTDPKIPDWCAASTDKFSGWASAERFRAGTSRWPAKTCDETVEDDPYRVILWSDIWNNGQGFYFDLHFKPHHESVGRLQMSQSSQRMLVDAFLQFCRLPPLVRSELIDDAFIFDSILESSADQIRTEYLSKDNEQDILDPLAAERNDGNHPKALKNIFDMPARNIAPTSDTLFQSPYWAAYLTKWTSMYGPDGNSGPLDFSFVNRCLDTLSQFDPTDELAEYYLAWNSIHKTTPPRKLAQSLIKKHPQSRRLYNGYAILLWGAGQREKAIDVWEQVLVMPGNPSATEKQLDILLWKSRIWCHLDDGDREIALKCLLSISGDNPAGVKEIDTKSSVLYMRAKRHLSSSRDFLLASNSAAQAALNTECLSLLYYLAKSDSLVGRSIEGALGVIEHFTTALKSYKLHLSIHHEAILQFSARLLWHHARTGPFRPALIRLRMEEALYLFPRNTIFLSLYAWNESRARIDDRVRAMLRDNSLLPKNDCVTSRLFAIRYEIERGNVHSAKAAFEHAVASEACKGNAGLWRLYVLWCAQSEDAKIKNQAKEVLYRGMRACPGVKALMMEAFQTLRPLMNDEEVKSVHKVMEEKEVRIHVDLEEWLEECRGDED